MDLERVQRALARLPSGLAAALYRGLKRLPPVARRIEQEYDEMLASVMEELRPAGLPESPRLPTEGRDRQALLEVMRTALEGEERRWAAGYASGAVYHGDPEHVGFLNAAYGLHSQSNPLHADLWPSTVRFEADIVSMTAHMLNGAGAVGTVTSGGTESILLAMKAYRDRARTDRGIARPEMVIPVTAHAAFDKAAEYFGLVPVRVPVDDGFRADPAAMAEAVTRNTAVVVGSAPSFAHGVVDPIADLAAVAAERGIGMHVDACLGGFLLPWAERLGHDVEPFDFRVEGVTSMSADTHKYGYAAKGTSVVLYRDRALRRHQYFTSADWPGGLYASPTLAGSRPGGLSAACWAAMVATGEQGYLDATRCILETAAVIKDGIGAMEGMRVLGDPLWVIAFASDRADIYRIMESMSARGWSLNGLQRPPAIHLAVTLRHTVDGVAERFLTDLAGAADEAADSAGTEGGVPLYGMAASFPVRGVVEDLLERYLDHLYDA
jgi:glutamate/tyrosine decarboxylase-like PLP-dependent enzyme